VGKEGEEEEEEKKPVLPAGHRSRRCRAASPLI